MKKRVVQLTLLVIVFLFIYNTYTLEREISLKYKGSDLYPNRFVKDFLSMENQLIIDSSMPTDKYRYAYGTGMIGDVITDFVFDTKEESTMDFKEYEEVTNKKPDYSVIDYKDGSVKIVDNISGKTIFKTNLVEEGYIVNAENLELGITWSNTKRYLILRDLSSRVSILIDIKSKKVENIPIKDIGVIKWSRDDKKAVLYLVGIYDDAYIMDMKTGDVENIGKFNNQVLYWTPDGEYIYYFSTYTNNNSIAMKIVRYDIENKIWEDIYKSLGTIEEKDIKWVSSNKLLLIEERSPKTINPFRMLLKPHDYYAVKVDIKRNRVKEKKLRAVLGRSYVWSYDNKYLYYRDERGFFKAKVNFD